MNRHSEFSPELRSARRESDRLTLTGDMTLVPMRLVRRVILRQDIVQFVSYISIGCNIRRRAQANAGPTGLPGNGIIFIDMDELKTFIHIRALKSGLPCYHSARLVVPHGPGPVIGLALLAGPWLYVKGGRRLRRQPEELRRPYRVRDQCNQRQMARGALSVVHATEGNLATMRVHAQSAPGRSAGELPPQLKPVARSGIWIGMAELGNEECVIEAAGPPRPHQQMARILIRIHGAPIGYVSLPLQPVATLAARVKEAAESSMAEAL